MEAGLFVWREKIFKIYLVVCLFVPLKLLRFASMKRITFENNDQVWLIDEAGRIHKTEPKDDFFYVGLFINNFEVLQVGGFVEMGTKTRLPYKIKTIENV